MKKIFLILLALAIICCGCKEEDKQDAKVLPIPVKVRKVERTVLTNTIRVTGTIQPREKAGLSFKVPGRIGDILVDEGDRVKQGDVVAFLEPDDYELNVKMAEAQVKALAPEYNRQQTLLKDKAITQADFEKFEAQYKVATYKLELAENNLADCQLKAPFDGEIALRQADPGEMAAPDRVIVLLMDMDGVEAEIGVPDLDINRFKLGEDVAFTMSVFPGQKFSGKVVLIGSMPDPVSRTYRVRVNLPNPEGMLKAGMIVTMNFNVKNGNSRLAGVPLSAILHSVETGPYVFVAKDGKAVKKDIVLGPMYPRLVGVEKGLDDGDMLIIEGQHYVRDGQAINVLNQTAQAG
jgi:membrane fusion protein (multidrug efflux system)